MAQRGALSNIRRWAYAPETGGVRGTAGTYVDPNGYEGLSAVCDKAQLADTRQTNSRKSGYASHNGEKSAELSMSFPQNSDTNTAYGQIFKAALGSQRADSTLVLNGAGTNSATVGAITSGVPDQIVKIEYNTGAADYLPVKNYDGTTITWAIQSSIASRTVTAYKNANQCSGDTYYQDPTADYLSFTAQVDQGAESNSLKWSLQGLVPSNLSLKSSLSDRTGWDLTLTGADWTSESSVSETSDASDFSGQYLGYAWDACIQDLTSPAAFTKQPVIAISGLNLAPEWIANRYMNGRTASGTIPGSSINGWKQSSHFTAPVELTLEIPNSSWITARTAKTKYQLFLVGHDGAPGEIATKTVCLWFPEVVLDGIPQETDNGGIMGYQLRFRVQESGSINSAHKTQCVVSFFNS